MLWRLALLFLLPHEDNLDAEIFCCVCKKCNFTDQEDSCSSAQSIAKINLTLCLVGCLRHESELTTTKKTCWLSYFFSLKFLVVRWFGPFRVGTESGRETSSQAPHGLLHLEGGVSHTGSTFHYFSVMTKIFWRVSDLEWKLKQLVMFYWLKFEVPQKQKNKKNMNIV